MKTIKRKRLAGILGCLLALSLIFSLAVPVFAVPQPPHQFWGQVTIEGVPAVEGTLVSAEIDGVVYASTTVDAQGGYGYAPEQGGTGSFRVPADDPDTPEKEGGTNGEAIEFYVADALATTFTFQIGGHDELELIVLAPPVPPVAGFSASPLTGDEPLTVVFTDESENMITNPTWSWDFGDGGTSTEPSPTHQYLQDGSYTVTLAVTTGDGTDDEVKVDYIVVADIDPVASFTADPTSGEYPLEVTFTDTSTSYDGITWEWDFSYIEGLGFQIESTVQHPVYTYQTEGIHTVALRVTEADEDSDMEVASGLITVTPPTPPTVLSTLPLDAVIDVSIYATVSATFSEDIQQGTNFNGIAISSGATGLIASIDGVTLTIDHDDFAYETSYTVTIPAGAVNDLAGNPLAEAKVWSFTTGTVDIISPTVVSTTPGADATSVAVDVVVSATFDEDVTTVDLSGITISVATDVVATLDEATDTLTIAHAAFAYETSYTVTIPAGAVNDLADNPNALYTWSFTTRAEGPISFPRTLSAGWNLLSTPIKLDADSDTLEQIFGESLANIEVSWRWDVRNQYWAAPTGYELSPLEAVYVKVSSGASATAEFVPYQDYSELPSRELQRGLNLIGPAPALGESGFPAKPLDWALISIAEAEGGLRGYTMVVSPGLNQPGWTYALGGQIQDLLPFKGYWVVMENADTLYGFSTTPMIP